MATPAFTQLLDRGIAAEGCLAAWCPTMDLLALVTTDGQLHVHRLNWQRLWWASPDAPITALEWRPDGKQLAVGLEDGTVQLLNTEDGEVVHSTQLLPDALVAISWTEAAAAAAGDQAASPATAASQLSGDRARRMFPPPPPPLPAASAGLAVGYATCGKRGRGGQAWPAEPPRLAVLACASAGGDLVLCTSGLFRLAAISLPQLLGCPSLSVLRLATAPSLQQLLVCWSGGGALRLSTVSMRHVGAHATQLHRLAMAAAHVTALLEGCQQSVQAVCKEWDSGQRECEASRAKLASLMSDYGASGEPASELQKLLATGAVGGALQQYITVALGEAGLKKLARAADAAVCAVHNLLTDHLQPQLEQLAFRLGELRGLALCLPWRRVTGLQPEQAGAAEQAALRLVMQAEVLRRRVVAAGAQYRTFHAWLLIVLRRMQEDAADVLAGYPCSHLETVADFLAGQYQRDTVGPLLGDSNDGSSGAQDGASAGGDSMLDMVLEILGSQALVQAADSTASPTSAAAAGQGCSGGGGAAFGGGMGASGGGSSLLRLLANLQAACAAAFERSAESVSPTLALADSLALGPAPSALAAGYPPGSPGVPAAAAAWEGQRDVLLLRRSGGGEGLAAVEGAVLRLPEGSEAAGLGFYKQGQLALLLAGGSDGGGGSGGRLVLLPQDALQFVPLPADLLADSDALQLCRMLLESSSGSSGRELPDDCRQRPLPYPRVQPPVAISASRGVGCVLAGTQRVVLYDLEEDDEEEEEEEEAEEEAQGGLGADGDAAFDSPTRI